MLRGYLDCQVRPVPLGFQVVLVVPVDLLDPCFLVLLLDRVIQHPLWLRESHANRGLQLNLEVHLDLPLL